MYKNTKDVLKAFRNDNEQRLQYKTNSSYKVLSSQMSSKTPRHHLIPCGHLLNPDFLRIYLISRFVTSTIPSLLEKTCSDGVCHHRLIVHSAFLLKHSCMSSLDVRNI